MVVLSKRLIRPPVLQNLELGILVDAWQKTKIGILEKHCSYDARIMHTKQPAQKRSDQGFTQCEES